MGETLWGEMAVGDRVLLGKEGTEDEATMILLPSAIPDWVLIPPETPHHDAGRRLRVRQVVRGPCPVHRGQDGAAHEVPTLLLADSPLLVAMCQAAGWCVYALADAPPEGP